MRFFTNASYRFIENRKKAYVFSGTLAVLGVAAMVINVFTLGSWLNYGVDFTGGTLIQVAFNEPVTAADIRDALGGADAPPVANYGGGEEFVIRAPLVEGSDVTAVREQIEGQLAEAFGEESFTVVRTELVGPTIGEELQRKALSAILFSFLVTLVYLAFRFEFRFGLAAVIATIHDIVLSLSILAIFRMEIGLPTVAAILTIVGYSLNDTIVVFDRIRENLHRRGARKGDQIELINRSINETLSRTVMTGSATLGTLLALLLFGPIALRGFSLLLVIGIVFGTYSSLYIAAPALIQIQKRFGEGTLREKKPEPATV